MSARATTPASRLRSNQRRRNHKKITEHLNGAARFRPWWVPWLWVILPVVVVISFYILPFLKTFITSFTDTGVLAPIGEFTGLANYIEIFSRAEFWEAVRNNVLYALIVVPLMVFLPLLLALLVKDHIPGIGFFRAIYYMPAITSLVVITIAWRYLLESGGPINRLLLNLGLISEAVPFLSNKWAILFCAMIITLWQGLPYYMILYLATLANVDRSLYEAAELDGANAFRRFWTVTVPGVKIMMYLVGVLCTIGSLKIFTEVYLLGGANSPTETITMYIRGQFTDVTFGHVGQADATSVFLFLFTLGFILASQYLQKKAENQ